MTQLDQTIVNNFYRNRIEPVADALQRLKSLKYSGLALVNKINATESVVDIGCGNNIFKQFIPNLTGVDPMYESADYQTDLQSFVTDKKFDVAFCLGSINYGTVDNITQQIQKVIDLLTPGGRIYWRIKLGPHAPGDINSAANKYPWTLADIYRFAEQFGFRVAELQEEVITTGEPNPERIYAEWTRL
jgi:SAM-dependent methyltransferase